MAFKEVSGIIDFIKYKEVKAGTSWEGYYEKILLSKEFNSKTAIIRTQSESVGLPLAGHLKYFLDDIPFGSYIKVEYQGLSEKEFKGRKAHQFQVWVDDEKSRSVPAMGTTESEDENDDLMPF